MITRHAVRAAGGLALLALFGLVSASAAVARPTYFDVFTSRYAIAPSDRLYACGNCHFRWTGTGARNDFGSAVEQQLYVGKSISQALADIEGLDTDGDGFTNLDEIVTFETLAGYNCDNFYLAQGAPIGYDTYITPMVASCLEPIDVRIEPSSVTFVTKAGTTDTFELQIINNGSTDPITVSSFQFLAGAHPALGVTGPAVPFDIPVGNFATLDITFSPAAAIIAPGTIRIVSSDPDEGTIDVPVQGFGFIQTLAPADKRARCFKAIDNQFRRYADRHRREWTRCFLDEVRGVACDTGARDLEIEQAEDRLRDAIGGAKDKHCIGNGVSATLLGLPATCGGECSMTVNSYSSFVDCLVCRQDEARDDMLRDGMGTAPPDVPPNTAANGDAYRCEKQIASRLAKGIGLVQKILGRCELGNVTSSPIDCAATHAEKIDGVQAKVDEALDRCSDSTGLLGCPFEGGTATCLSDAAETIGASLVDVTFGLEQ